MKYYIVEPSYKKAFVDTYFEIQCNPQITPCDENGNKFEENED